MKKTKNIVSALLFLFIISSLYRTPEAKYSYNGVETYTMKDSVKMLRDLPNKKINYKGNNRWVTNIQGMNVGKSYIYVAKIHNDVQAQVIYKKKIDSVDKKKETDRVAMKCHHNIKSDSKDYCTEAGHANELLVVVKKTKTNYLLVTTNDKSHGLARYIIDGNHLYFTGYFKITDKDGKEMDFSAMKLLNQDDKYFYFIFKSGETFYYGRIEDNNTYFPEMPKDKKKNLNVDKIHTFKVYQIATLDKKNAVFATNSSTYVKENLETWIPQGFSYNSLEKRIYAPYFQPDSSKKYVANNVILTYDVSKVFTSKNMDYKTNKNIIVFPSTTSFILNSSDYTYTDGDKKKKKLEGLEIESCGFRTGQGTTGDMKMYFSANVFPDEYKVGKDVVTNEGIYSISYTSKKKEYHSVAEGKTYFNIRYDCTEGKNSGKNSTKTGYFSMSNTRHVYGLKTKLRPNYCTRSGYNFNGWYVYRSSDGTWLYVNKNSRSDRKWYKKNKNPSNYKLENYTGDDLNHLSTLSKVNNDYITLYAQWKKK